MLYHPQMRLHLSLSTPTNLFSLYHNDDHQYLCYHSYRCDWRLAIWLWSVLDVCHVSYHPWRKQAYSNRYSLPTNQYRCYFNQGPNGPPFNDATYCSGPDSTVQGGITASMSGGSFIGALISGFVTDIFGRKSAIQMGSVIWLVIRQCAELKAADTMHGKAYRKYPLLRLPKHCYVNPGSIYQRLVCRNMLSASSCVCWRARASSSKGPSDGGSAMGNHMGCFGHVLYFLRLFLPPGPCIF